MRNIKSKDPFKGKKGSGRKHVVRQHTRKMNNLHKVIHHRGTMEQGEALQERVIGHGYNSTHYTNLDKKLSKSRLGEYKTVAHRLQGERRKWNK